MASVSTIRTTREKSGWRLGMAIEGEQQGQAREGKERERKGKEVERARFAVA